MTKSKFAAIVAAGVVLALAAAQVNAQEAAQRISLGMALDHMAGGQTEGGEVTSVMPDRTGAALGFKVGDILIEAGGRPISLEVLRTYLQDKKPGDQLSFKVKRAGAVVELTGTALAAPEGAPPPVEQPEE